MDLKPDARGGGGNLFKTFTLLFPLFYLVPQDILVTAPKFMKGGRMVLYFQLWFQPTCSCHQLFCLVPRDVTAPEIARGVPLPVYINVYVCILTSKSILQSSTELAHVGYIYIFVYSGFVYFSLCCVFI